MPPLKLATSVAHKFNGRCKMRTKKMSNKIYRRGYALDANFQLRCRQVTLAEIATYFCQHEQYPSSRSELGRMALEELAAILVENGRVEKIEDSAEAASRLDAIGLGDIHSRTNRGFMTQLQLEAARREGIDPGHVLHTRTVGQEPTGHSPYDEQAMEQEIRATAEAKMVEEETRPETIEESLKRRKEEEKQMKKVLGSPPAKDEE